MKKGFTLIELLIVIAIIAIIAGAVLVAINPAKRIGEANNSARWSELNSLASAIAQYTVDNGGAAPQCDADGTTPADIPDAIGESRDVYIVEGGDEDGTLANEDVNDPEGDGYIGDEFVECDLKILVDEGYLSSIAVDPAVDIETTGITGYLISQDDDTDAVCVWAENVYDPENTGLKIEVCR